MLWYAILLWSRPLSCTVDSLLLPTVGESTLWRIYRVGDVLLVGSDMGTSFYALSDPERGPYAILGGWFPPVVWADTRGTLPPVVVRFSSRPIVALQVARVDLASGVILDSLSIPGVPIAPLVNVGPLLDGRFLLVVRGVTPESRFNTWAFLIRLDPFHLQDTLSLGGGGISHSLPIQVWEEGESWVFAPHVPHNRGYPGMGGRDDLGGVVLVSPEGHILRNRLLPWPLFSLPYLFIQGSRLVLNALPTRWSPPGVRGRIWLFSLPDLHIHRTLELPGQTLWIPLNGGMLEVDLTRARARFVPDSGAPTSFLLPVPESLHPLWAGTDQEGVWMLLEPFGSWIADPRNTVTPPSRYFLLHLSPQGTWALDLPPGRGALFLAPQKNRIMWGPWPTPGGILLLQIRCPAPP